MDIETQENYCNQDNTNDINNISSSWGIISTNLFGLEEEEMEEIITDSDKENWISIHNQCFFKNPINILPKSCKFDGVNKYTIQWYRSKTEKRFINLEIDTSCNMFDIISFYNGSMNSKQFDMNDPMNNNIDDLSHYLYNQISLLYL